jgi:hypothetical protein
MGCGEGIMNKKKGNRQFVRHGDKFFQVIFNDYEAILSGSMWGQCGHCGQVIGFATNGAIDTESLREAHKTGLNGPREFVIEEWVPVDNPDIWKARHWKKECEIQIKGVKWELAQHTLDDSMCGGLVSFSYETKSCMECGDWEAVIPEDKKYISLYISKLIEEFKKPLGNQEEQTLLV